MDIKQTVVKKEVALEIKNLYKAYGKKSVLKNLNLRVYKGEVFGFIGRNGIGKSTTIDCIIGLKDQNKGNILVLGNDTKKKPLICKQHIGYVPSEPITYEMMSGVEYLKFIASSYKVKSNDFNKKYKELLSKFSMTNSDMNRKIREYSHGMKQKICLMASLIHNPDIWILDEPSVGLDIVVYKTLLNIIKEFALSGKTVFVTSHNIDLVKACCDRVAIINDGNVNDVIDFKTESYKKNKLEEIFLQTYQNRRTF